MGEVFSAMKAAVLLPVMVRSSMRPSPKSIVTRGTGRTDFQWSTKCWRR